MNSDSTANMSFFQMLEHKQLSLLEVVLQMGEEDEINAHASFRYKLKSLQLAESLTKLRELVDVVKKVNPSLIQQINKAKPSNPADEMANYAFNKYKIDGGGPPS